MTIASPTSKFAGAKLYAPSPSFARRGSESATAVQRRRDEMMPRLPMLDGRGLEKEIRKNLQELGYDN